MTVGDMLTRNANKFPKKLAVVSEGRSFDFETLNKRVNSLSNRLLKMGLQKGDRVGILAHNCYQFIELYFAAAKTGGIFCPYNNHLKAGELKNIIDYSAPGFLVLGDDYVDVIKHLKQDLSSVDHYIGLEKPDRSFMEDYEDCAQGEKEEEPGIRASEDDVISMFFTAGTTGKPKGALRTNRHLISNAVAGVIELKVSYEEKVLITFPMYHVAFEDNLVRHSFMPNTFYLRREGDFNPAQVLEYISRERITRCQLVPTMIHSLIQVPDVEKYDLSSLRLILYAAAPMPVELLKKALTIFSCGFAQMYGQTESGPIITVLKPEDHILDGSEKRLKRLASSGKPVVNYAVRIVDEMDNDVPVGQVGEIIGRSEAMMMGYWQMPEETAEKLKNGWLHTGDVGKVDEDGYVYVIERKNDMIISGGVNIYPREIEEILYRHPAVSEASVIGVPDEHWGEIVKAVVVLKEGCQAKEAEIIEFCGKFVAGFKKPKTVDFWTELPKSPQGKILKREIRTRFVR